MKRITLILSVLLCIPLFLTARNDEKEQAVKNLIESGRFKFTAQSAIPLTGGKVDLTSTYDLIIDSLTIKAWLPYFGRAYRAEYGRSDGGIKFEEKAKSIEKEFNEKKKVYNIKIEVKTEKDSYKIYLNAGISGYGNLSISSNNRQAINYFGIIEPLEEK